MVDLLLKTLTAPDRNRYSFEIEDSRREVLLDGLGEVRRTLDRSAAFKKFLVKDKALHPWMYEIK